MNNIKNWQKNLGLKLTILAVVVVIAITGLTLAAIHAATSNPGTEAESGNLSTCASNKTDSTASSSKAVQFTNCSGGFTHPGVLISQPELDAIKNRLNFDLSGSKPVASAKNSSDATAVFEADMFNDITYSGKANLSFTFTPPTQLTCQAHTTDQVCNAYVADAAFTDAIIWYLSGDTDYADKANQIMNDLSENMTAVCSDTTGDCHSLTDPDTGFFNAGNTTLNVGWITQAIVPAAEIMRYAYHPTGTGHTELNVSSMTDMLKMFIPLIDDGWPGSTPAPNWITSFFDATIDIGVFTGMMNPNNSSQSLFDLGVSQFRAWVPSLVYNSSDTINTSTYPNLPASGYPIPTPNLVSHIGATNLKTSDIDSSWRNPQVYISGMEKEYCRDLNHSVMGLDGIFHAAETARLQGVDLWPEQDDRLAQALETYSEYRSNMVDHDSGTDTVTLVNTGNNSHDSSLSYSSINTSLCGGSLNYGGTAPASGLGLELGYQRLKGGYSMPWTANYLKNYSRPRGATSSLFLSWEDLLFGQAIN